MSNKNDDKLDEYLRDVLRVGFLVAFIMLVLIVAAAAIDPTLLTWVTK